MRTLLLLALTAGPASAQFVEVPAWRQLFDSAGVAGVVALYEPARGTLRVSDSGRAGTPRIPASTFKILSSLAALEARVVPSPDAVTPWDSVDRCLAAWNRDLSLREAYRESAFWVYQRYVRGIGPERMHEWMRRAGYGNADTSGGAERFWLDGGLRLTLLDQVRFLERLQQRDLPFSEPVIAQVLDVMTEQRSEHYVLRGKTGWARPLSLDGGRFADCRPEEGMPAPDTAPEIGWYVGLVERGTRRVYFALNLDIRRPADAAARRGIVRRILRDEGLIDP